MLLSLSSREHDKPFFQCLSNKLSFTCAVLDIYKNHYLLQKDASLLRLEKCIVLCVQRLMLISSFKKSLFSIIIVIFSPLRPILRYITKLNRNKLYLVSFPLNPTRNSWLIAKYLCHYCTSEHILSDQSVS